MCAATTAAAAVTAIAATQLHGEQSKKIIKLYINNTTEADLHCSNVQKTGINGDPNGIMGCKILR